MRVPLLRELVGSLLPQLLVFRNMVQSSQTEMIPFRRSCTTTFIEAQNI